MKRTNPGSDNVQSFPGAAYTEPTSSAGDGGVAQGSTPRIAFYNPPPPPLDEPLTDPLDAVLPIILPEFRVTGELVEGFEGATSFFEGTNYSAKVLEQMDRGFNEFHSFSETVRDFEFLGTVRQFLSSGGEMRTMLEIPGGYGSVRSGGEGVFQFMKDEFGEINHRFFQVYPVQPIP